MILGLDNGTTGTYALLADNGKCLAFGLTPTLKTLSYTKTKQYITHVDVPAFAALLKPLLLPAETLHVVIERPMVNPTRFKQSMSGVRADEAFYIMCVNFLQCAYQHTDSKEWQKTMLPHGMQKDELKRASKDVAIRMFPQYTKIITEHKDGDALLIAEYYRRKLVGGLHENKI